MNTKPIGVLAEGAWGSAIAHVLLHNGYRVLQWCHDPQKVITLNTLNNNLQATQHLADIVEQTDSIFQAIPVNYLRSVLEGLDEKQRAHAAQKTWAILSKGIEKSTGLLPSQIIQELLGQQVNLAVLMGPSFAHEVIANMLTGVIVATADNGTYELVRSLLENDYFRLMPSTDLIGVQWCGAYKNCIALGVGLLQGLGYGHNTKALLMTKALDEMKSSLCVLGGNEQTAYGLAGLGDLMLTCYSTSSKNTSLGQRLGQGEMLSDIQANGITMPEGITTLQALKTLCLLNSKLNLPLILAIYEAVYRQNHAVLIKLLL